MQKRSIEFCLIFVLTLAVQVTGFAQRGPSFLRKATLGGSHQDVANTYLSTPDSGIIVFGSICSNDKHALNSGFHPHSIAGRPYDNWVVKLTKDWNIEWQKAYGGSENDLIASVAPGHNGGYIMTGTTQSRNGDVVGLHGITTYPYQDAWVVKINTTGSIEWAKCYGGSLPDNGHDIIQTYDGGYLLAAWASSTDGDITSSHGGYDMLLTKINSTGSIVWGKTYGGTGNDSPSKVFQTQDSGFIVFGTTDSNNGDVVFNHGAVDVWILKIDRNGTIQWQRSLGGPGSDYVSHVVRTKDGGYAFTGGTNSMGGDVTYWRGGVGADLWVVKLSDSCTIQWEKTYGGTNDDQ